MAVKQLEDPKTQYLPKVIFIIMLVLAASFLFKYFQAKPKDVLGENTNLKKSDDKKYFADIRKQGTNIYNQINASAQKEVGVVLGAFTDLLSDTASKSANTVKEYVFTNTVGNLLKQIDKLPSQEKELIKKEICK